MEIVRLKIMANKYYIYGCKRLLLDLHELIDSASDFEEQGKTPEQWVEHHNIALNVRRSITWGHAINRVIKAHTEEIRERREINTQDLPF